MSKSNNHGHAAEHAYHAIKGRLLRNEWPDGTYLRETELAESLGVSRTPVRDALRRLAVEGLVETIPNAGTRVRGWNAQDLDEIFGLRSLLEGYAARLAAQRLSEEEIGELRTLCEEMEAIVARGSEDRSRREALAPLNERFHTLILQGSRNGRLAQMTRQVVSIPLVLRTFTRYEPEEIRRSMSHHREMVEAFAARDPIWAESIMLAHLQAGFAVMKRNQANPTG
ncbi:GntR family transcriptional regulator [Telmatospirillum sp. J64-1]|uniref:GntR family transcriptional regulator n=1 Tax=Telmatospirillum sp. J64-1 TaxID=2502183 RepID=UPI00115C6FEF|nr:GntR family transcriptional regulator [Telmatospirillum sp. J64-1]